MKTFRLILRGSFFLGAILGIFLLLNRATSININGFNDALMISLIGDVVVGLGVCALVILYILEIEKEETENK